MTPLYEQLQKQYDDTYHFLDLLEAKLESNASLNKAKKVYQEVEDAQDGWIEPSLKDIWEKENFRKLFDVLNGFKDKGYYIHFTNSDIAGQTSFKELFYPGTTYNTPAGIYGYPLNTIIYQEMVRGKLEFATDRKKIVIFKPREELKGKVFNIYSEVENKNDGVDYDTQDYDLGTITVRGDKIKGDITKEEYFGMLKLLVGWYGEKGYQGKKVPREIVARSLDDIKTASTLEEQQRLVVVNYKKFWHSLRFKFKEPILNEIITDTAYDDNIYSIFERGSYAYGREMYDSFDKYTNKVQSIYKDRILVNLVTLAQDVYKIDKLTLNHKLIKVQEEAEKLMSIALKYAFKDSPMLSWGDEATVDRNLLAYKLHYEDSKLNSFDFKTLKKIGNRSKHNWSNFGKLWNVTRSVAGVGNAQGWNTILRRLGFTILDDHGTSVIHSNEPYQAVFLDPNYGEVVYVLNNHYDQYRSHVAKAEWGIGNNKELNDIIKKYAKVIQPIIINEIYKVLPKLKQLEEPWVDFSVNGWNDRFKLNIRFHIPFYKEDKDKTLKTIDFKEPEVINEMLRSMGVSIATSIKENTILRKGEDYIGDCEVFNTYSLSVGERWRNQDMMYTDLMFYFEFRIEPPENYIGLLGEIHNMVSVALSESKNSIKDRIQKKHERAMRDIRIQYKQYLNYEDGTLQEHIKTLFKMIVNEDEIKKLYDFIVQKVDESQKLMI